MSIKISVTFFVVTLSKTVPIDNEDYTQPEKSSWLKNLLIISGIYVWKICGILLFIFPFFLSSLADKVKHFSGVFMGIAVLILVPIAWNSKKKIRKQPWQVRKLEKKFFDGFPQSNFRMHLKQAQELLTLFSKVLEV